MDETVDTATEAARRSGATGFPWRIAGLVAGDAISFLVFAASGLRQHNEATGLFTQVAITAFPFALGWFLVSPWVGAYRRRATEGVRRMLTRTELAWLASYPAALILRVIFAPDHQMPLSFAIVILLANAVFLGVWRSAFAFIERLATRGSR